MALTTQNYQNSLEAICGFSPVIHILPPGMMAHIEKPVGFCGENVTGKPSIWGGACCKRKIHLGRESRKKHLHGMKHKKCRRISV